MNQPNPYESPIPATVLEDRETPTVTLHDALEEFKRWALAAAYVMGALIVSYAVSRIVPALGF